MARLFLVARGADRPHLEIARVELRGLPLDDATLARRIPAFEHEDAALAVGDMRRLDALEPLLECDQIIAILAVIFEIGRAHVWTPVTNAHLVCRLLLEKKKKRDTQLQNYQSHI